MYVRIASTDAKLERARLRFDSSENELRISLYSLGLNFQLSMDEAAALAAALSTLVEKAKQTTRRDFEDGEVLASVDMRARKEDGR